MIELSGLRTLRNAAAAVLVLVGGSCSDLATVPRRVPTSIRLSPELITTTAGELVPIEVKVLDQHGEVMENIPPWATPEWSSSDGAVVNAIGGPLKAVGPGQATVTASIAGMEHSAVVRVNPASLKLDIATVQLEQAGGGSGGLAPGVETTLRVFLVADAVNFFQPEVEATLLNGDQLVSVLKLTREGSSIPHQLDTSDPGSAWTATIPGHLVQPGLSLIVEADPDHKIPRSAGSVDRYPEGGAFFLAVGEAAIELRIAGVYLTQSVQRFDNSIPLVQGRNALLRVFLIADEENPHRPMVRATFLRDGQIVHQVDMLSEAPSIPLTVQEGLLSRSWNATIPGAILQPGVSLVVEADPGRLIPLKIGSEPRFPATGALPLNVRPVPPLWLRMIPIQQSAVGTIGNITSANLPHYIHAAEIKFPLADINADIRQPYITTSTANTSTGWLDILNEIRALRVADGSQRYYYGVLKHPGGNQIGGLGYIGLPAAIGYDDATHGPETFAHELGHTFSLQHAPCGGPASPDPFFPHFGGGIGVFGYDLSTGTLKSPSIYKDLMTYCSPEWISDYNYGKVLTFRDRSDWGTGPDASPEDALLVWGGMREGDVVLEPAFQLPMRPVLPSDQGSYTLSGLDENGNVLFSYRFEPEDVDHLGARSFAFAIPARIAQADRLAELVVSGPEGEARRRASGTPPGTPGRAARPGAPQYAELTWDAAEAPMALIRDPLSGQVISFARDGRIVIPGNRLLEVYMSDGVRSTRSLLDLR